jgi:hypothetical protein
MNTDGDVSREHILWMAAQLGWPAERFGPTKMLRDEGDYRAEPMLNGVHRIELYERLHPRYRQMVMQRVDAERGASSCVSSDL